MSPQEKLFRGKIVGLIVVCGLFILLVSFHVPGVNGPAYWMWSWRRLNGIPLFPSAILGLLPFLLAQGVNARNHKQTGLSIGLLMMSSLLLQLIFLAVQSVPLSLDRLARIVESPGATSYFTDAAKLSLSGLTSQRHWMQYFPSLQPYFAIHSTNKPPGPILYYLLVIQYFGVTARAAWVAGLGVGVLSVLAIPATYRMLRQLLGDHSRAFCGASFLSLCPAFVLFFPELDPFYGVLTCLLILAWHDAMVTRHRIPLVLFALIASLAFFMSYSMMVLGFFLIGYAMMQPHHPHQWEIFGKKVLFIGLIVVSVYGFLYAATGFNALRSFKVAFFLARKQTLVLGRGFPHTIPYDFLDFALGSGWLGILLACYYFVPFPKEGLKRWSPEGRLSFLSVLQIGVVGMLALLPGETARVWLFMLPLLMIPVGCELATWSLRARCTAYVALWAISVVVCQNMVFIQP